MSDFSLGQGGVAYILLSRFNIYIPRFREMANLSDDTYLEWCKNRVDLFKAFTLPSVVGQKAAPPFHWLIYFDTEINIHISGLIDDLKQYSFIHPVFIDLRGKSVGRDFVGQIRQDIGRLYSKAATYISTTRIDTDDAINSSFFYNVNDALHKMNESEYGRSKAALTFPLGAQYFNGNANVYLYEKNPFVSLIERADADTDLASVSSVFAFAHYDIDTRATLFRAFVPIPQWLQVIHGANAANEYKSELPRISDTRLLSWFSLLGRQQQCE